ncbi:MAG: hypothetical protein HWN67_19030 [Candidatus Helarchaeota archaeon]|nr:hypothetical protein [Candidatus Helarchaeota archaeon]
MSDRFWDKDGRPFVLEGETIQHSVPEVRISGSAASKGLMEIGDLKMGDLYVTNTRLIFIGEVRKSKDLRQKFDGLSIFYDDITELGKVQKDKFSVLCVFKKGRWRSQKARVYFKKLPQDQVEKVTDYIKSALQDIEYAETGERPEPREKIEKKKKEKKQVEEKTDPDLIKAQALFSEIKEDSVELMCPACGGYVSYRPGMKTCPLCGKAVKFFPD